MFGDQHVETLGGAQVSMRLQRRFLEKAGHTVTVVAPAMHGARARGITPDPASVDMPSIPVTLDREYAMTRPTRRMDRWVDAALQSRPPVDVVHVQADFWGALIGHRFAHRHGLPVVHTMHNRVDVGIEATVPLPRVALSALNAWQRRALRASQRGLVGDVAPGSDGWSYLRGFAIRSDAITAPSLHFARRLEAHGVVPRLAPGSLSEQPRVDVVWNGIDDDVLEEVLAGVEAQRRPGRPRFVWLGRMSPEKRLLPFLEAVVESRVDAEVEIVGGGAQLAAARRIVERGHPLADVTFAGRLTYPETLRRLQEADAVVQTSIGFETQGMTIFEAASLGTPAIVSDPDLAAELGSGFWAVGGGRDAAPAEPDASVEALAATLRAAAADVVAGTAPSANPTIAERFRQSSRTAAMVEVYVRVTA